MGATSSLKLRYHQFSEGHVARGCISHGQKHLYILLRPNLSYRIRAQRYEINLGLERYEMSFGSRKSIACFCAKTRSIPNNGCVV